MINCHKYFVEYLDSVISDIKSLKEMYFAIDFESAINLILSAKGKVVVSGIGKSGFIARKIASSLASTGTSSFFVHPSEASHGDLGMINQEDVVLILSNSGQTSEIKDIVNYCKSENVKLISITSNKNWYLYKESDCKLLIPSVKEYSNVGAPCNSVSLMLALGDALVVTLHSRKNFKKDDYAKLHPSGSIGLGLKKIKDIMEENFVLLDPELSVFEALIKIASKKSGFGVIIDEQGNLKGTISEKEIRNYACDTVARMSVSDIMTKKSRCIEEDLTVSEGLSTMELWGVNNAVVVKSGSLKVVGIFDKVLL